MRWDPQVQRQRRLTLLGEALQEDHEVNSVRNKLSRTESWRAGREWAGGHGQQALTEKGSESEWCRDGFPCSLSPQAPLLWAWSLSYLQITCLSQKCTAILHVTSVAFEVPVSEKQDD